MRSIRNLEFGSSPVARSCTARRLCASGWQSKEIVALLNGGPEIAVPSSGSRSHRRGRIRRAARRNSADSASAWWHGCTRSRRKPGSPADVLAKRC